VNYSLAGESLDWAVPVVYARDPNSRLCPQQPRDIKTMPSPAVSASSRRSAAQHKVRSAVWDTHYQFPALRATLERINAAQTFYGFEIVDLSVPMDAWHVEEGIRYLDADHFAERLMPQMSQLGVHYMSAIVAEAMICDLASGAPTYNIHAWWPGNDRPAVLIFSTQGLEIEPTGPATDRAIANAAVCGIAGYLLGDASHETGPRD
jgi:hypothetical protein